MAVQITIRNVPDAVRDELAARAARAGRSMQEYLLGELARLARRPSMGHWLQTLRERKDRSPRHLEVEEILAHRDADRR